MKVRTFKDNDLQAIVVICNKTLKEHIESSGGDVGLVSAEFLKSTLDKTKIWATEIDNEVVGYLQYQIKPPDLIINGLAVFPEFQRKGIGTKMFLKVVSEAQHKECKRVVISVQPTNKNIWELYVRVGFKEGENKEGWNQTLWMNIDQAEKLLSERILNPD